MDASTARRLNAINLAFYRTRADEFDAARQRAWSGWWPLLALLRERDGAQDLEVLDVGCGNARFGAFLAAEGCPARRYLGIDASPALLAHARARALPGAEYRVADLVADDLHAALPAGPFDLVVLMGVLHHVPGRERRRALVASLLDRAAPRGLVALAAWQIDPGDPHVERIVPWEVWNRRAAEPVDVSALEPGDHLLAWGPGRDVVRYGHFASDAELAGLLASLSCRSIASWRADGGAGCRNVYHLLAAGG